MVEWIKFVEGDYDTYPRHSKNWDDTSEIVLVHYKSGVFKYDYYCTGYTDWDGDNHYWNLDRRLIGDYEVVSWAYFNRE